MAKRKKRVINSSKKKKLDDSDENPGGDEVAPPAKKVAASSTSYLEDDVSQNSSFSSIETGDLSKGSFGFSSHFWCNYCEFSTDAKQELVTHMRQHMIKCSFCKYSSLSQADVTKHEKCEHGDNEVEVDSSSSSTDYNMDKDPCCACVFCDFMTYSTEYMEKHTISKHPGMLPKSVAKMISKSVSAKVRQADALFYIALSNERTEKSPLERELLHDPESPSSSNVIVIEEESKKSKAVKPEVKELPLLQVSIKDETVTPQISSCVKLDPSVEKAAEKLANEISKVLSEKESPSDWKVKVETMYCPCCPFSNVSIEKLKCHTFSQHVRSPAIARNNSSGTDMDVLDVTFFCVKETCTHSTNTCSLYEEHLMRCCALHQTLQDDELGRLRETLRFLLDFHKKHCLKTATGFLDFVSSVNKMQVSENVTIESILSNASERNLSHHSSDTDYICMPQKELSTSSPANTLPTLENQHYSRSTVDSPHPQPKVLTHAGNQHTHLSMPIENNRNNQSVRGNLPNQPFPQRSSFLMPSNDCGITYDESSRFQSSAIGSQDSQFPQAHRSLNNQSVSSATYENNFPPSSSQMPVATQPCNQSFYTPSSESAQRSLPHTSLNQESYFDKQTKETQFQNNCGSLPLNSCTTLSNNMMNTSSENAIPLSSHNGSFMTSDQSLVCPQKAPYTTPFAAAPQPLLQHQQPLTSSHNQPFPASLPPTASNPPQMVDLLSDSYSILLDEDLNLTSALDNPMPGDTSTQLGGPAAHGNPASCNPLNVSVQQPVSSVMPSTGTEVLYPSVTHFQQSTPQTSSPQQPLLQEKSTGSEVPYPSVTHIQQSTPQASSSQQPLLRDVVPPQSSLPVNHHGQGTVSLSNAMATHTPSQDFMSLQAPSFTSSFTHQHTSLQQMNPTNLQQPSTTSQYPSAPILATTEHMSVSTPQVSQAQQGQPESALFPVGQNSAAYSAPIPNSIPNSMQTIEGISQGQSFSPNVANTQSSMPSFLETSSGKGQPTQSWQGNQAADIPNFLVPTSQSSTPDANPNLVDPGSFPNHEAQSGLLSHPNNDALSNSNQVTPVKNQPVNFAKNMVGNSPLSPSIYLNGQAPRHNRSNWTTTDMMPRGAVLPQIRPPVNAAARYPRPSNVRQNLFPPYQYRGRGRPRGPRLQTRLPKPDVGPQDDDVIVTAVVRGPQQQTPRHPIRGRGGVMRGQRPPMLQGPRMVGHSGLGRGMIKNAPTTLPSKKPFDVSKHFVDLACVVNTANDDGEDEIQIMGVTPGHNANTQKAKGAPKVVDARKFSFCCVHCGRDQRSKQVMKQHMKANHNDSLLGAFRNVDTGQFLFFCPQLRCEFMTYDENRLTEHLFSCYNLDRSKQLPFDLQSALKNLRSLKIRKVNTNANMGQSQTNPIDLDGQGLRDTFNNNLTDAFDDMVENTIGRHMTKPSSNSQPAPNATAFPPQARPPGQIRPQRGRPISNNLRMSRAPYYQPRQGNMPLRAPGQGNVRMPPTHPPYRMPGRRNFRSLGPRNMMPSRRGPVPVMTRPNRGRPPNPRSFLTNPSLGNEDQPILIDIDSECPESTMIPQKSAVSASGQPGHSTEATTSSSEVIRNLPVHESDETTSTDKALTADQPVGGPYTEVEVIPQHTVNDTTVQQSQLNEGITPEVSSVPTPPTSNVDNQVNSASNSYIPLMPDESLTPQNNEEQVNAILLDKVFAKVPHMPKKLSQRLVLRFKEFAAKRGVVITPNSKVIDEFVERISYKGSNPLSKHQQQPQQQQYSSSAGEPSNQTQQVTATSPQNVLNSECGNTASILNESTSLHQSQPRASQNQSDVSGGQNSSDTFHSSDHFGNSGNQSVPSSIHTHTRSGDIEKQVTDNSSPSQNQISLSENENNPNSSQSNNQMLFSQSQNEPEWKDKQLDNHSDDDHDIVETKVILPPRDLKFSGGFADIAKSAIDNGKIMVKSELHRTSSPSSRSASPLDAGSRRNSDNPAESSQISFACMSSNIPTSGSTDISTRVEIEKGASLALREQVSINEKLLKKELLPMSFPMTQEGETILVQSSVDHLVSGNESLEVDIAGKPLDSNNVFKAEATGKCVETANDTRKAVEDVEVDKSTKERGLEPVIDKSTGRLVLKVKKGVIPRRRNDPGTHVVIPAEEDKIIDSENGETFVRRSERKRKIRRCETVEDAMNELDSLISDDDDEYQVESEDESYDDDSDYEREHSNKKKIKTPKDPDAFDVKQKGPYVCWICYKRFARCFGVKKHICLKHSKAFCAIIQTEAGDSDALFQLILFCPRNCKYATTRVEAFSNHITNCQKGEITADGHNFIEMQNAFILLEFVELQGHIASGAMTEMIKQMPPSTSGRKRQRSLPLPETNMEKDEAPGIPAPKEDSNTSMMSSSSNQ